MTEKYPVIIAVRLGSTRLPNKALKNFLDGKCMLDHIVKRIRMSPFTGDIVVATTTNNIDDELVEYAKKNKLKVYRGSETNVAHRIMSAAQMLGVNYFFEVLGDNPFIDPEFFRYIVKKFKVNPEAKYISFNTSEYNYNGETEYPIGIRVQFVRTNELDVIQETKNEYFYEHATSYFYDKIDQKNYILIENDNYEEQMSSVNLAVNTFEDFARTGLLLNEIKTTSWYEVYERLKMIS